MCCGSRRTRTGKSSSGCEAERSIATKRRRLHAGSFHGCLATTREVCAPVEVDEGVHAQTNGNPTRKQASLFMGRRYTPFLLRASHVGELDAALADERRDFDLSAERLDVATQGGDAMIGTALEP